LLPRLTPPLGDFELELPFTKAAKELSWNVQNFCSSTKVISSFSREREGGKEHGREGERNREREREREREFLKSQDPSILTIEGHFKWEFFIILACLVAVLISDVVHIRLLSVLSDSPFKVAVASEEFLEDCTLQAVTWFRV